MTLHSEAIATVTRRREELPWTRGLGLIGLLAAEVTLLSLLFDPMAFGHGGQWYSQVLLSLSLIPRSVIAAAVAIVLFGGRWLKSERAQLAIELDRTERVGFYLACHLIAFVEVLVLSASLFRKPVGVKPLRDEEVIVWGLTILATFVLWARSALPFPIWLRTARRGFGVLSLAALAAVAACQLGRVTQSLWPPLCRSTFWVVEHLLRLVFSTVISDPVTSVIGTPSFRVSIAPVCSGCEGIGLIWVLLTASFWIFRDRLRFPAAFLLLPIGTVMIWLLNSVRIAALVAIGTLVSPEIAVGGFHSYTGWIAFNLLGLGMLAGALRCRFFCVDEALAQQAAAHPPTAAYLAPLLAIVATTMVTGAFSEGFDRLYPLRLVSVVATLWWFRNEYTAWRPTWSWEAVGIGVAVFALWIGMEQISPQGGNGVNPWTVLSPFWAVVWLISRVVGSVVLVPLAEELAFRGYLLRRMIAADFDAVSPGRFTWLSVVVSSAAFGALHGRWLAGTLAGLLYALVYYRRGRLGDAVLAHALTNALIAVTVLAAGSWSLW